LVSGVAEELAGVGRRDEGIERKNQLQPYPEPIPGRERGSREQGGGSR